MSENEDNDRKTVLSLIWSFLGYTTAHGFARISESKTILQRTIWIVIVASAFVVFFLQVISLLETYMSRPVGTQITMKHETSIPFPSVTLCNLNIVRKTKISSELHNSFESFFTHNDSSPSSRRRKRRSSEDPICFNYLYCKWKYYEPEVNETKTAATTEAPTTTAAATTTKKSTTTTTTTPRPTTPEAPATPQATTETPTGPTGRNRPTKLS
ncbi:hypothetical protein QZH41_012305 [Actinostola sp. cb2023]|nr:hypothetical protein QZH41_012305 [Actinostola sp. cb2023]